MGHSARAAGALIVLTLSEIRQICPNAGPSAQRFVEPLNDAAEEFAIDTPERLAAWLGNIAHESAQLTRTSENLNYSAERLMEMWPTRFPRRILADQFAHRPEAIANYVYANRGGNGDGDSGDGWRYRGAGLIQLTFKESHLACAAHFGIAPEKIGDWLRAPEGAARSAGWFWSTRALNVLADRGQFKTIVRKITGAATGLAEREMYWKRARRVLACDDMTDERRV